MKSMFLDSFQLHSNSNADGLGLYVSPGIEGLESPEYRLSSFNLPATDGALVPNQLYGGRMITLKGKVFGQTVLDYRGNRRDLQQAVQIKRVDGLLEPRVLKFTTMDDLALQINVFTKSFKSPDIEMMWANFKLDLFAPDFQILSQELKQSSVYIFSGGGMEIPMGIPMDMSEGASIISELENEGNILSYPTIILYGPIIDPVIDNQSNGQQMTVTYTIGSGERIEIDTQFGTVLHFATPTADGTNARQYVTGDLINLDPGLNSVKLTTSSYNDTAYMLIRWRDTYSGV